VRAILAALLLFVAQAATAELFKIVGPDGKVTYADKPPFDAKTAKITEIKVESYNGPPQINPTAAKPDWAAILKRPLYGQQASAAGLVMYSAEWCGPCKRAKKYMDAKGIAYVALDIDKNPEDKAECNRLGGGGIPLFLKGTKTMKGFSEAKLDSFLKGGA
jgi:glutaredoxin